MKAIILAAALAVLSMPAAAEEAKDRLREDYGVEVVALRRTAAGYMLDLRVRVLDADKAKRFFDPASAPSLREEDSGALLAVTAADKVGPLRQTIGRVEPGRVFAVLFGNPAQRVRPGERVTLAVGKDEVGALAVEG
jgi:hypothetical protein